MNNSVINVAQIEKSLQWTACGIEDRAICHFCKRAYIMNIARVASALLEAVSLMTLAKFGIITVSHNKNSDFDNKIWSIQSE